MRNFEGESSCYEDRTTKNIKCRINIEVLRILLIIISTLELNLMLELKGATLFERFVIFFYLQVYLLSLIIFHFAKL